MLAPSTKADFHEGRAKIEKNSIKNDIKNCTELFTRTQGKSAGTQ
jgi:hypothetical protein